jgi:outer membrane lipoprotein-sorting protein
VPLSPRWFVPAVLTGIVVGGVALGPGLTAGAASPLPAKTPAQLLTSVAAADLPQFSGTVQAVAHLGLPSLPSVAGADGTSLQSLLSGSHTLRVWYGGQQRQRVALLGQLAETDVIRNGQEAWTYDSGPRKATHVQLPAKPPQAQPEQSPQQMLTPQELARQLLAAVDPTTRVTVGQSARVAGRSAYELELVPRSADSLVSAVTIAVDAKTTIPLRVRVNARGQDQPAVDVAYTDLRVRPPAASLFQFRPPAGARVQELTLPTHGTPDATRPSAATAARVLGTGWDSVVVMPAGTLDNTSLQAGGLGEVLGKAQTVTGAFGSGRIVRSALLTVLVLADGRVYAGAVTPARLVAAANGDTAGAAGH